MMRVSQNRRKGAAMMEFILVFPIYALLLGGLFMIGELLSARLRWIRAERMIVWSVDVENTKQIDTLTAQTKEALWAKEQADGRGSWFFVDKLHTDLVYADGKKEEPRYNAYGAEAVGGITYTLKKLPPLAAAFLSIQERQFPNAPRTGMPLSMRSFTFLPPFNEEGDAVSMTLFRPSGTALQEYQGYEIRRYSGMRLYLNMNRVLAVVGDWWPYLEAQEEPQLHAVLQEELVETGAYERNPNLELFTE